MVAFSPKHQKRDLYHSLWCPPLRHFDVTKIRRGNLKSAGHLRLLPLPSEYLKLKIMLTVSAAQKMNLHKAAFWIMGCVLLSSSFDSNAQQVICDNCGTERKAYEACEIFSASANSMAIGYGHSTRWKCVAFTHPYYSIPMYVSHEVSYEPYWGGSGSSFYWYGAAPPKTPKAGGPVGCGKKCGNPIDLGSGNKFQQEFDIELSGLLRFERYYNSESTDTERFLGYGWSHFYDRTISDVPGSSPQEVTVRRHNGQRLQFRKTGGNWLPDADIASSLQELVDGYGNRSGWRYVSVDDREVEEYDAQGALRSISRNDGSRVDLAYADGLLDTATDEKERRIEFTYDAGGNISAVEDASGASHTLTYDTSNRLASVTRPGGSIRIYHYGEDAYGATYLPRALTGITDERGNRFAIFRYHHYFGAMGTAHAEGADNHDIDYMLDGSAVVKLPSGATRTLQFATIHGIRRVTSEAISCTGCPTRTRTFTHDSQGRLDVVTDEAGTKTDFNYDTQGRLLERIDSSNVSASRRTVQIDWHTGAFKVPLEKRIYDGLPQLVGKETWTYNTRGQALTHSAIDPLALSERVIIYAYCEATDVAAPNSTCPILGLLKSIDGPQTGAADTTTYTYHPTTNLTGCGTPSDACHRKGDLHQVIAPGGLTTTYASYDLAGRPARVVDANGVATDLEYNARGWLTARKVRGADDGTEADDAITTLAYDNVGQVTQVTQPDGAYLEFSYDAAHRLTGIEDNLGNTVTYQLDGAGNRISEETRDAANVLTHSLSRVYDQLGQLETLADALSTPTDFTYDAAGQVDTVTDAFNRTTDNDYDPLGRLKRSIANVNGTGSERAETQFQYDALDNLTAVIDPKGLTTSYAYNGLGDLVELNSPDTGSTTYTYDEAGNRASQTDARGITSTYGYDALGRLTAIDLPTPGQDVGFGYDAAPTSCAAGETFAAGRLSGFTDPSGSTDYCYDRRGNVVRKVQSNGSGGTPTTVRYSYNHADRLVSMTYPSGVIVTYGRDANGRITGITTKGSPTATPVPVVSDVDYLPFGPAVQITFGNGRTLSKAHDTNYGIDAITDSAVDGMGLDYTLDAVGNVTGLGERLANGSTASRTVEYDDLDRLTALKNGSSALQQFEYDATGNRTLKVSGSTAGYAYSTDSHRLDQVGSVTRSYDGAGNTTVLSATRSFTYDDRGRMAQYLANGVLSREYRYNARGERVAKLIPAAPTTNVHFVYDEAGRLIGEYRPNGTRLKEYVWLDDTLVAVLWTHSGSAHQYVLTDHLGTPRAIVNPGTNAILWRWDLTASAFGDHAANQDPDGDGAAYTFNLRYPGQYYDVETGLHYNYFRDYDPSTGRYLQSDPIGLGGGPSTYGYVWGSPFSYSDSMGLAADICSCGNNISVTLPVVICTEENVSDDDVRRLINAAEKQWTTSVGGVNVELNIIAYMRDDFYPPTAHHVKINDGPGGWETRNWFTAPGEEVVMGHEIGHVLLSMGNRPDVGRSILAPPPGDDWKNWKVTEHDVRWMLNNPDNTWRKNCGCK